MFKRAAIEKSFRSSLIVLFLSELTVSIGPLIDGVVIAAFLGTNGVKEFGIVNPALIATVVLTATDIAGDFLSALVFHAGMLGMGLATSIAYYMALLVLLLHFRRKNAFFKPRFKNLLWKHTGTILKGGCVSCVTLGGATIIVNLEKPVSTVFPPAHALKPDSVPDNRDRLCNLRKKVIRKKDKSTKSIYL